MRVKAQNHLPRLRLGHDGSSPLYIVRKHGAFGHTAVSLATSEARSTKAPRRRPLGGYSATSGLAVLTQLPDIAVTFQNPIYVNAGEFVAIAKKKIGTAPSAGVIAYNIMFDYGWE